MRGALPSSLAILRASFVAVALREGIESGGARLAVDATAKSSQSATPREGDHNLEELDAVLCFETRTSIEEPLVRRRPRETYFASQVLRAGTRRLLIASTDSPLQHAAAPSERSLLSEMALQARDVRLFSPTPRSPCFGPAKQRGWVGLS